MTPNGKFVFTPDDGVPITVTLDPHGRLYAIREGTETQALESRRIRAAALNACRDLIERDARGDA